MSGVTTEIAMDLVSIYLLQLELIVYIFVLRTRSRDSNSLELSQFFENDDSDGYRLAEFLQKRRGCAQRQNVLFMNYEPLRLSVDVQVEKVPERSGSKEEQNNRSQEYDSKASAANIEECANSDDMAVSNNGMQSGVGTASTDVPPPPSSKVPESLGERKPTSPLQQSKKSSPRFSAALRKSGGYSPADHLRRYSLKRLSRISGRRTLLQEFENTVTDSGFVSSNKCSFFLS